METMLRITALTILFALCARHALTTRSSDVLDVEPYLVIYPNSLIPGLPLDVRVTIVNASSTVDVTVGVWDIHQKVIASNTTTMSKGETSHIQLSIPVRLKNLGSQGYAVRVTGSGGLTFNTSGYIKLEDKSIHVITQTDKTRYAGGQDVKFRSVLLLPNLLAYTGNATVTVYDGKHNKIRVFGHVMAYDGVIEGTMALSQEPVFGVWSIVTSAQDVSHTQTFTVQPYVSVLPKFSVFITKLGENDTDIEVKVIARSTFNNMDVHGSCRLELFTAYTTQYMPVHIQQIHGSVIFHLKKSDITSFFGLTHLAVSIRALVTDTASSVTMVAEISELLAERSFSIGYIIVLVERFDNRQTFVPGMNFYASFFLEREGVPFHNRSTIAVTVKITTTELKPCLLAQPPYPWLETITTTLPQFLIDADDVGMMSLNIPTPNNAELISIRVKLEWEDDNRSNHFYVYPLSINTPMLRVAPSKPCVQVGETVTIAVNASEEMTGKLIVEVYARGIALDVKSVDVMTSKFITVSVTATPDMVPYTHVVVSHVTSNNSFMYDYALIKIDGSPLKNQVIIGFNTTTLEPGQDVEMILTADPNSTVYVLTEDRRNRLLGTDNDIFLYELDEVVTESGYNISSSGFARRMRRSVEEQEDGSSLVPSNYYTSGFTFMDNGLIVLPETNNILGRVTYTEVTQSHYKYRNFCSSSYITFRPYGMGWYPGHIGPSWHPDSTPAPGIVSTLAPGIVSTLAPGTTFAPTFFPSAVSVIRSDFPDTWMWEKFLIGPSGKVSVPVTVPDSITSWVTSVFATNENTGFGLATTKPQITVKKDFFVTMDPPKLIVLGEEFLLQLTIFNFFDSMQQVLVQVNTTDDPVKLMESTFNVNPGEGHSTFFQITPKKVGPMTITAHARAGFFTNKAVDEIVREVTVKPNGVHKRTNEQHLVEVSMGSFNQTVILTDPPNMVAGSKSVQLSITGDIMTNSIEGLEKLISMPFGCGEQTMLNFASNIYVTRYLQTVGKLTEKIRKRAMSFMESGLQRELTYKHYDGSFSAFGDRDSSGSSWLTAFVLKCFAQAGDGLLEIDESIKTAGMNWLLRYQHSDGSFYEPGRIINTQMQDGTASGLKLTSFILISILENTNHAKETRYKKMCTIQLQTVQTQHFLQPHLRRLRRRKSYTEIIYIIGSNIHKIPSIASSVAKASSYLEKSMSNVTDMYTYAIVCYALVKSGKSSCFNRLESLAVIDGDKKHWNAKTKISHTTVVSTRDAKTRATAADIEATSYTLLAYLTLGEIQMAKPIVKWLISQRNPSGGFQSTQDTIVSLQALSLYASHGQASSQVDVNVNGGDFSHAYSVTKANADVLHTVQVPASLTDLHITATGQGNAVVDVTMSYYVNGIEDSLEIAVVGTIIKESLNSISVRTCVHWNGVETSGMIVAEVEMPTGFSYDVDALNHDQVVRKHELLGQNVALYFDGIHPSQQVCPIVKLDRTDPVVKSQACHITVYDYYEPTNQARTRYESGVLKSSTICDVCQECTFCKGGSAVGQIGVGK